MVRYILVALIVASLGIAAVPPAHAVKRTVCTITVNSSNEREAFRRHLPQGDFEFVELVERGRPDWLASACRRGIRCDMLVISGHFNGSDFFSDQLSVDEFLPVAEMERVSCSDSCPGLFSRLKEVYLFGCETLNTQAIKGESGDIVRSLAAAGHSRAEAERVAQSLVERHRESNREFMRRVFPNVPAIYGFSSVAPLGATAGPILGRYLQSAASGEVGTGRANRRLLSHFAAHSMSIVGGLKDSEAGARHRAEACRFVDDRLSAAQKLGFLHELLGRDIAETRMFFERIERFLASVPDSERTAPSFAQAFDRIARDHAARARYLEFARVSDQPSIRVRMTDVALRLGWLSPAEHRDERVRMIREWLERASMTVAGVDQTCAMNRSRDFDAELSRFKAGAAVGNTTGHAAALACLGSTEDHARMLSALTGASDQDAHTAELYFHHRPIGGPDELRIVASGIARMTRPEAQIRALGSLARHQLSDGAGLAELVRLFPVADSANVQRAIAGVFLRSDHRAIASPELVRVLREHRLKGSEAGDVIDILIRRLEPLVAAGGLHSRL